MTPSPDRRTRATREAIKDAFLALIPKGGWRRLSVTLLCRKAGIARATFYLHYASLDDVLSHVLIDAFQLEGHPPKVWFEHLRRTAVAGALPADAILPLCQRAADSPRYRPLLLDEDLRRPILTFLYNQARDDMVPLLMEKGSLSRDEADLLFRFTLEGSFAVNTALGWKKSDRWRAMQDLLLRFKMGGLMALQKKSPR